MPQINTYLTLNSAEINTLEDLDQFLVSTHPPSYKIELIEHFTEGVCIRTYKGHFVARNRTKGILLFDIDEFLDEKQISSVQRTTSFFLVIINQSSKQITLGYWEK